jgi:hypothetical protein
LKPARDGNVDTFCAQTVKIRAIVSWLKMKQLESAADLNFEIFIRANYEEAARFMLLCLFDSASLQDLR